MFHDEPDGDHEPKHFGQTKLLYSLQVLPEFLRVVTGFDTRPICQSQCVCDVDDDCARLNPNRLTYLHSCLIYQF